MGASRAGEFAPASVDVDVAFSVDGSDLVIDLGSGQTVATLGGKES